ncbi:helix-turn-helix domain-containing protein [Streptomyces sp. NPDC008313]|uniref:helix-turn-helix domain-containing protein n=1 Tax=Streptomyces sp. NPDC008313 TaxID=3364826 RepID=UPI0036E969ED
MTTDAARTAPPGGQFGRTLRSWRVRAGLTQQQLGLRVGYHHSLISRLEAGWREPPAGLVPRLDSLLGTGGELAAIVAAPREVPGGPPGGPLDPRLFAALPGAATAGAEDATDPAPWPPALPAEGLVCPLHGTAGCVVPDRAAIASLLNGLTAPHPRFADLTGVEADLLHGLTAVLACLTRDVPHGAGPDGTVQLERLLHATVRWAEAVNRSGRLPYGQLRIAAQYAQVAGRLRMRCGQGAIAMAWFGHGLRWAESVHDAPARATLLSDMCTLVRLDQDAASTLGYAEAIGAVDHRRRWVAALAHLYQARGQALGHDATECLRQIRLARRVFGRLTRRDRAEAPWLDGAEGELRVESAVGGALRDLAALTGDRGTARRAVAATARSRDLVPPTMRDTRLLLTLRLADGWACAGDPRAAVAVVSPVLDEAVRSRELMIRAELRGLHGRLLAGWGDVRDVREYRGRVLDAGD